MRAVRTALLPAVAVTAGGLLVAAVLLLPFDVWTTAVTFVVLLSTGWLLLSALLRREPDRRVVTVIKVALLLKLVSSLARYAVAFVLYDGRADAQGYFNHGRVLAEAYARGERPAPPGRVPGTGFIDIVTGVVLVPLGPAKLAAFVVFSFLGFWGLFLFYRAFVVALPDGNRLRYAVLVMLLPSLLFWPSSIGKEAWMMAVLGATAYGTARLSSAQRGGLAWLLAGTAGAAAVRPHIALIVLLAAAAAYALRPAAGTPGGGTGKVVVLTGLLLGGAVALSQVGSFFGVDVRDGQAVSDVLTGTAEQTGQGGSAFEAVGGPLALPVGILTVLFRPLPFEAANLQGLLASFEGLLLVALFARYRAGPRAVPGLLTRQPYVTFCLVYSLLFCVAFSSFQNFGILTRQRVQVLPFVLVLLAVAVSHRRTGSRGELASEELEITQPQVPRAQVLQVHRAAPQWAGRQQQTGPGRPQEA